MMTQSSTSETVIISH